LATLNILENEENEQKEYIRDIRGLMYVALYKIRMVCERKNEGIIKRVSFDAEKLL
jgi:hypothetical protein